MVIEKGYGYKTKNCGFNTLQNKAILTYKNNNQTTINIHLLTTISSINTYSNIVKE